MEISVSKLSSKGQLVLPKETRAEAHAKAGDEFVLVSEGEKIELFKLSDEPKKLLVKQMNALASRGQRISKKHGIESEAQVVRLALKRRG